MKVLFLTTHIGQGGAERVFHTHAKDFSSFAQVEEAVFLNTSQGRAYENNLPLHILDAGLLGKFGVVGRLIGRSLALRRLVREGQFDVVISHMDGANWVNVLSGSSVKKILVVHGTLLGDKGYNAFRRWLRLNFIVPIIYSRGNVTVAVSRGIARELQSLGASNISVLVNYFDINAIKQASTHPLPIKYTPIFNDREIMINVGRLAPQKNQAVAIHALSELRKRRPTLCLIILGSGPLGGELHGLCRKLDLMFFDERLHESVTGNESVYFLGYQSNPFMFLARSSIFVLPSLWEGFPLALCEAMACGVPVIAADCPTGPREILTEKNLPARIDTLFLGEGGLLVPTGEAPHTTTFWVEAVNKVLETRELSESLVLNGFGRVAALDKSVMIERWKQLLE